MELKAVAEYLFERLRDVRPVVVRVDGQEYAIRNGAIAEPIRELMILFAI
jgi:hypothetical protein